MQTEQSDEERLRHIRELFAQLNDQNRERLKKLGYHVPPKENK